MTTTLESDEADHKHKSCDNATDIDFALYVRGGAQEVHKQWYCRFLSPILNRLLRIINYIRVTTTTGKD